MNIVKAAAALSVIFLIAGAATARQEASPAFDLAEDLVDYSFFERDTLTYFNCFDECASPWDFSVLDMGDSSSDGWGAYPCGSGVLLCPPEDEDAGYSAVCIYSDEGYWQDEYFISPPFAAANATSVQLAFVEGYLFSSYCSDANRILVGYGEISSPDDLTVVAELDCDHQAELGDGNIALYEIDLTQWAGAEMRIALNYRGIWAESWWVDDFSLMIETDTAAEDLSWGAVKVRY